MNDKLKVAYRHLLYVAMLDTRNYCQSRDKPSRNPVVWFKQYHASRTAGAIDDWLHNLAYYSSIDFDGFDEPCFWEEHDYICSRFPHDNLQRYRRIFDECLSNKFYVCWPNPKATNLNILIWWCILIWWWIELRQQLHRAWSNCLIITAHSTSDRL
jgi:hypothetical protein